MPLQDSEKVRLVSFIASKIKDTLKGSWGFEDWNYYACMCMKLPGFSTLCALSLSKVLIVQLGFKELWINVVREWQFHLEIFFLENNNLYIP